MTRQLRIVATLVLVLATFAVGSRPAAASTSGPLVYGVNPFDNKDEYSVENAFVPGTGHYAMHGLQPFNGSAGGNAEGGSVVTIVGGAEAGLLVRSITGLAVDPTSGTAYAVLSRVGSNPPPQPTRYLATINLNTGEAVSLGRIRNLGSETDVQIAAITFSPTGTMYGVSGDGSSCPACLYTLNKADGVATHQKNLETTDGGETIAFNPDDGLIYHSSGSGDDLVFETLDPANGFATANVGFSTINVDEITGLGYDPEAEAFIAVDLDRTLWSITTSGTATVTGATDQWHRGLVVLPQPVGRVAADDLVIVQRDSGLIDIPVRDNDIDGIGEPVGSIVDVTQPEHGTAEIRNGATTVGYDPDQGYCNNQTGSPADVQPDTFTYTLFGGSVGEIAVTVECPVVTREITLRYSSRVRTFKGAVTSPNAACVAGAQVDIVRIVAGVHTTLGSTQTLADGRYKLKKRARGRYYSQVNSSQIPNTANCQFAQSPTIKVR